MAALVAWAALVSGVALTQFDPTSLDELSQLEALQAIDPGADDLGEQPLPSAPAVLPAVRMVADRWGANREQERDGGWWDGKKEAKELEAQVVFNPDSKPYGV